MYVSSFCLFSKHMRSYGNGDLHIANIRKQDGGVYQCEATDVDGGKIMRDYHIDVLGKLHQIPDLLHNGKALWPLSGNILKDEQKC